MRTFGSFTYEELYDLFQVKRINSHPLLTEWVNTNADLKIEDEAMLREFKEELLQSIYEWNEDELKMFFIGPLIRMAKIKTESFKPFTQRTLIATIETIKVTGRIDFMIAKGMRTAKPPYFCIHEYKQEIDSDGEPLGQVLIAMLAAQTLNENKFPILGAYISGRNWFFIVLEDKEYSISNEFDASSEDIFQIFAILQKSKEIIQRYV